MLTLTINNEKTIELTGFEFRQDQGLANLKLIFHMKQDGLFQESYSDLKGYQILDRLVDNDDVLKLSKDNVYPCVLSCPEEDILVNFNSYGLMDWIYRVSHDKNTGANTHEGSLLILEEV